MIKVHKKNKSLHYHEISATSRWNTAPSLPTAREGNVFTGICLSTIGLFDTGSLLGLVTGRSVRILPECFLVITIFTDHLNPIGKAGKG